MHGINLNSTYLAQLIANIGLQAKSNSTCTGVRRIRYGEFGLDQAVVMKDLSIDTVLQSMHMCKSLLTYDKLQRRVNLIAAKVKVSREKLHDGTNRYLPT